MGGREYCTQLEQLLSPPLSSTAQSYRRPSYTAALSIIPADAPG